MSNVITQADSAAMLLTQRFDEPTYSHNEPITTERFTEIEKYILDRGHSIDTLLTPMGKTIIDELPDAEQINMLLGRSFILGARAGDWTRDSIDIICRTNPNYPNRLRQTMGDDAPPVIYYIGNLELLAQVQLSVVMPADAVADIYRYAQRIGQAMQRLGASVATRAATEYDKNLISATTGPDSSAVGIMDTQLKLFASDRKFRSDLTAKKLLFMSPNAPESVIPNDRETNAQMMLAVVAGRSMIIDSGPPPSWHWAAIQPRV